MPNQQSEPKKRLSREQKREQAVIDLINQMFIIAGHEVTYDDITSTMPKIIFVGIILTYAITAALNVYFLPLPLLLSIPASLMLQLRHLRKVKLCCKEM